MLGLLVCLLPVGALQWLGLLYGLGNSVVFVAASLRGRVEPAKQVVVWVGVGVVSLVLLLCVKWIFLEGPPAVPLPPASTDGETNNN